MEKSMATLELTTDKALAKFASYTVGRYCLGYEYLALYWASGLFETIINRKFRKILTDNNRANGLIAKMQEQLVVFQQRNQRNRVFQFNSYISSVREIILAGTANKSDQILIFVKDNISLFDKINLLDDAALETDSIYVYKTDIFKQYIIKNDDYRSIITTDDIKKRLHNFRFLRNRIVHDGPVSIPDEKPNNKDEFIYYIWSELDPNNFKSVFDNWKKTKTKTKTKTMIQTLFKTTADYMVRAVDEDIIENIGSDFSEIKLSDFEDMFNLRDKMGPLKNVINDWLLQEKIPLMTDILTTIDTTSAYIWMPLVSDVFRGQDNRKGIFNCSVSILATPLDFRIYMDFGGYAKRERFKYYQFLESDEYRKFMKRFAGKSEMQVFDIDWFSSIVEKKQLKKWLKESGQLDDDPICAAKLKLRFAQEPITWNRMLHGYIFEKKSLGEKKINFALISQYLSRIIELHNAYQQFIPLISYEYYLKSFEKEK
jgi:hypothetical protein